MGTPLRLDGIINPSCRRHPILATLTNSTLDILDTYTTVSQSAGRYPPTSPIFSSPVPSTDDVNSPLERTTQQVEEWQKEFISISAIWVALRHGWVPSWKSADLGSPGVFVPTSSADETPAARGRALSLNAEITTKLNIPSPIARRKFPTATKLSDQPEQSALPRRATSTGAAFVQKRRTLTGENSDQPNGGATRGQKADRRAFSGDWDTETRNRFSLAAKLDPPYPPSSPQATPSGRNNAEPLAPSPLPNGRRAVSAYYEVSPVFFEPNNNAEAGGAEKDAQYNSTTTIRYSTDEARAAAAEDQPRRGRHQRWKNVANWFRRRQGR
ncbi:hypothetical protein F4779DRAFT_622938 [Xylariaceae sp. FL0662B]|nr:hypothetical protein F4779DRAFT_622938 [Xylariaceae sp. FL0662B]